MGQNVFLLIFKHFRMGSVLDEWLTPSVFDEVDRCGVQNGRRLGVTIGLSPTLRKILHRYVP